MTNPPRNIRKFCGEITPAHETSQGKISAPYISIHLSTQETHLSSEFPSQQTSRASLAPPSNSAPIGFGSGCTAQTAQTLGALDHGTIWHIYIGVNPPSLALCLFHDQLDQEFGDSTTSHVNPQFAHRWRFCFIHVQTHHEVSTTLCFNCAHLVVSAHAQHIKLSMNPLIQHLIPSTKQ